VAESGLDYVLGEAFPHDVLLDQNGGVSFKKGCFVGQEVVSRMQHRGSARRRILIVSGEEPLPEPGTEIQAGSRPVGVLGSTADRSGLALVRIDRVKAAMDSGTGISAGPLPIELSIPPNADFTFPDNGDSREGG
jgi:folate-binding protein YgfZ